MNRIQRALETRQAIRYRIARQRRRLDRQIDRVTDGVLLVGSWRRFVQRHPGRSLLAAAGIGVLLSGLLSRQGNASGNVKAFCEWVNCEALTQFCRDFLSMFKRVSKTASQASREDQDG